MMKRTLPILFAILIALVFSGTSSAFGVTGSSGSSNSICKFKKSAIPSYVKSFSKNYAKTHAPTKTPKASDRISVGDAHTALYSAWRSFGYSKKQSITNSNMNVRQARAESGLYPNAIQNIVDVNSGGNEAGGLFQFIPATFNKWAVQGYSNRFAPLDSALAVVNAQVNAKAIYTIDKNGNSKKVKVLNGTGGWAPLGGTNACR